MGWRLIAAINYAYAVLKWRDWNIERNGQTGGVFQDTRRGLDATGREDEEKYEDA